MEFSPEGHGAQDDLDMIESGCFLFAALGMAPMELTLGFPVPVINGILLIFVGVKALLTMKEDGRRVCLERSLSMKRNEEQVV